MRTRKLFFFEFYGLSIAFIKILFGNITKFKNEKFSSLKLRLHGEIVEGDNKHGGNFFYIFRFLLLFSMPKRGSLSDLD